MGEIPPFIFLPFLPMIATKPEQKAFPQIEQGVFPARCYSIVDLWTQESTFSWVTKKQRKVCIFWEFPTELYEDDDWVEKPFTINKTYTLSLFEQSKLREHIESWLGRGLTPKEEAVGFEMNWLLGLPCQIQVLKEASKTDSAKVFANVNSVISLPKWMTVPPQIHESVMVDVEDWNSEKFTNLPKYYQDKIKESFEYKEQNDWTNIPDVAL